MLTLPEIGITLVALLGVGYNASMFIEMRGGKGWSELRIVVYALFVVMPQLLVILYAFLHFARD